MVDAIGLAASIVQIVSTGVQVSVYLYNFAETVSSAGKALKEISNDIAFTASVLDQLRQTLESEKHHGTASKEALLTAQNLVKECSNLFEAILALIKKHFPRAEESQRKRTKLDALKWPFIQPKIEVMRSNLEKHKTKLILMTQVLTFAKIAASERRSVEHQLEEERQKLEALVIVAHRVKAQPKYKVSPYGLTEVYSPLVQASVDLVFVHGMFGHPKETWTCDDVDVFWPAELLPPILEDEGTRILTYGYEAGASTFADGESRHKVSEVVESLGRDLASNRQIRKATERPLVFVAHSVGGIVVKGVLAYSVRSQMGGVLNLRSISVSTYGVVFLSTPHNLLASHIHLLCEEGIKREMCSISHTIDKLKAKHTALQILNRDFLDLAHRYQLYCFRETLEPRILDGLSSRLSMLHVEATCIKTDHYSISKFGSDTSPGFDNVCAVIQNYVYRAPLVVPSRWVEERTETPWKPHVSMAPPVTRSYSYSSSPLSRRLCHPRIHNTNPREMMEDFRWPLTTNSSMLETRTEGPELQKNCVLIPQQSDKFPNSQLPANAIFEAAPCVSQSTNPPVDVEIGPPDSVAEFGFDSLDEPVDSVLPVEVDAAIQFQSVKQDPNSFGKAMNHSQTLSISVAPRCMIVESLNDSMSKKRRNHNFRAPLSATNEEHSVVPSISSIDLERLEQRKKRKLIETEQEEIRGDTYIPYSPYRPESADVPEISTGRKIGAQDQILSEDEKIIDRAETTKEARTDPETQRQFFGFHNLRVAHDDLVVDGDDQVVGRLVSGVPKMLLGRVVDEDGHVVDEYDKLGDIVGRAERWQPEEKRIFDPLPGHGLAKEFVDLLGMRRLSNIESTVSMEDSQQFPSPCIAGVRQMLCLNTIIPLPQVTDSKSAQITQAGYGKSMSIGSKQNPLRVLADEAYDSGYEMDEKAEGGAEEDAEAEVDEEAAGMQAIHATNEERQRAKEEIVKLLRQWTTCDTLGWAVNMDTDIHTGRTGAMEVDFVLNPTSTN